MPKGPTPSSGRLSKEASGEAGGAQGSTSGRRSTVVGGGGGALGPKATDQASMGTGGKETRCSLQERLQVDLSLRLCAARKWRGLLADRTYGQRKALFSMALNEFAKEVGAGKERRVLLVVDLRLGGTPAKKSRSRKGYTLSSCPPARPSYSRRRGCGC